MGQQRDCLGPVQIGQQVLVPLSYRVAVAERRVSRRTAYLSLKMMPPPAEAGTDARRSSALVRRRTTCNLRMLRHIVRSSRGPGARRGRGGSSTAPGSAPTLEAGRLWRFQ